MLLTKENDVIVAIATGTGRSGVGVIRLSGADVAAFIRPLIGKDLTPRYACYSNFKAADGSTIDAGLALYFPAPHSFTGEAVLELQAHGSPVVLTMLQNRCIELGARLAEPGEFTKRAFLNNKLDLSQAESIADLINATSQAAARSAIKSLQGVFSTQVQQLVAQLTQLRVLVEATLDFPEEDIDPIITAQCKSRSQQIRSCVSNLLATAQQGSLLREGVHVALIGRPNVGKSSLLNALAGFEAAIVTNIAGTTRDSIRELIHIEGIPVHIIDTAGIRETQDPLEQEGIIRTWQAIERADLALLILDDQEGMTKDMEATIAKLPPAMPCIQVYNKIDLTGKPAGRSGFEKTPALYLSVKTGEGLSILHRTLLDIMGWHPAEEGVFIARSRHVNALHRAATFLDETNKNDLQTEIFAENLRLAQMALAEITGEFTADDLLGEIFSTFCIGK